MNTESFSAHFKKAMVRNFPLSGHELFDYNHNIYIQSEDTRPFEKVSIVIDTEVGRENAANIIKVLCGTLKKHPFSHSTRYVLALWGGESIQYQPPLSVYKLEAGFEQLTWTGNETGGLEALSPSMDRLYRASEWTILITSYEKLTASKLDRFPYARRSVVVYPDTEESKTPQKLLHTPCFGLSIPAQEPQSVIGKFIKEKENNAMNTLGFSRNLKLQDLKTQLDRNDFLHHIYSKYVSSGKALLAFRNREATIYFHGKQLCNLKERSGFIPTVNQAFLPLRTLILCKDACLSEEEWRSVIKADISVGYTDILPEILEVMEYKQDPESLQVSNLYKFSPLCTACSSDIILLDIEAAFAWQGKKDRSRIDVVLYHTKNRQLIFAEVKRLSDVRLQKNGNLSSEICEQMKTYHQILESSKNQLIDEYNKVIDFYSVLSLRNISHIDDEKDILLGLWITEHTSDDVKVIKSITKEVGSQFPAANIGQMSNLSAASLEKVYQIFSK